MASYEAALGRSCGKVDTDAGGLARYSLKLEAPPGIHPGTEPDISLEYCQGTPNGSLGVGWALGGMSTIRRGASTLANDALNPEPRDYDRSQPKLTLDGAELLKLSGSSYFADDAIYTTETEDVSRTVTRLGAGYVVRDASGRRSEYGTTDDSRVTVASTNQLTVREWRLKRSQDYYGNAVVYDYVRAPQTRGEIRDENTCYLSSIHYTSNENAGFQGRRCVLFEYSPRPDPVVQTVQGDKCTWASLLTAIRFAVIHDQQPRIDRSFELEYSRSPYTGDSLLTQATEVADEGQRRIYLLPSKFSYTAPGVSKATMFSTLPQGVSSLPSSANNVALFPMNVSGRCRADLACVSFDPFEQVYTLKTYLAIEQHDGTTTWEPSDGPGGEARLPKLGPREGFPNILSPDMSNDGRSDLIIPYRSDQDLINFSISKCIGTGYEPAYMRETSLPWTQGAKFMAMDHDGRGAVDVLQIFNDQGNLAFRNFSGVFGSGTIGLGDAVATRTDYEFGGTVDWCQLTNNTTGSRSLLRIWINDLGMGESQFNATTFALQRDGESAGQLLQICTSTLGNPFSSIRSKYSVLPCDINADGTQDLVIAYAEFFDGLMTLSFSTYLGDGYGGFRQHGPTTTKSKETAPPFRSEDPGQFHVTNLNGSNYPSLSYVYQTADLTSFTCLSTDGRSDGSFGDVSVYTLAENLPSFRMEILSVDINGNGMGDWLFYSLETQAPQVVAVYNSAQPTDLLASSTDPMGLRTDLTYGCLSDSAVYMSGVDWKAYSNEIGNEVADSYPVIAAPNYVVTKLEHRNDSSICAMPYELTIRKTYSKARINVRGRGWQGFAEINTFNITDKILTTEAYFQSWPLNGIKCRVDTKNLDGQLLRSVKVNYETRSTSRGPWTIYRNRKMLEQTDMVEADRVCRSNSTRYEYDDEGNMTLLSLWETQGGQVMYQSWKRCKYAHIDGVTNMLVAEKVSAVEQNRDMERFEPGDSSLTIYENEPTKAILKSVSVWSSDIGDFSKTTFKFNEFGKEIETINSAGLRTSTTYDEVFKTFVVKSTEEGAGVSSTTLNAFDEASGLEVASLEPSGELTCFRMDRFGRTYETRAKAEGPGPSTMAANEFLSQSAYVADGSLKALLADTHLDPQRQISFERQNSPSGKSLLATKVTTFSQAGLTGQEEVIEYADSIKQVRKRCTRDGDSAERVWVYWEYNSCGQQLFESYPHKVLDSIGADWLPDRLAGSRSTVDTLGRPTLRVSPSHGGETHAIVRSTTYLDGGARIRERTMKTLDANNPLLETTELATLERRYVAIDGESHVVESINECGLRSEFAYDAFGRLISCKDPAGRTETRTYSSRGKLLTFDNPDENIAGNPNDLAVQNKYDVAGHLVQRTNAAKETVAYRRDAKGRPTMQIGHDGRVSKYTYDVGGFENLRSISISPDGAENSTESLFEFTYDHRGRLKDRKLTIWDPSTREAETFTTSTRYNWQNVAVQKIYPDGAILNQVCRGSDIVSSSLTSGASSTWSLQADTTAYSPFGRPEKIAINGTGIHEAFTHEWKYDIQGFPVTHGLKAGNKTLVEESYVYNDLDQIVRRHELISGSTTDYQYHGKRLASSRDGAGLSRSYSFDISGNMVQRGSTQIAYSPGRAIGTTGGKSEFDITYDNSGRMIQRVTEKCNLSLRYDSFGALQSLEDSARGISLKLIADFEGETLLRKHSDGSTDLFISDDFSIHTQPDGSRTASHKLTSVNNADGSGPVLGVISNAFEPDKSKETPSGSRKVKLNFTNTKGNVTHVFNGDDGSLYERLDYDDYGLLPTDPQDQVATYEGNFLDAVSGLLNFGARWYDPLVGRFTTPDDILDVSSLMLTDGLNRFVFENNDPINHTDPTGHWSWSAIGGCIVGGLLIGAAVAVTVATGGAAAPLAAIAVGALASGGIAGVSYSVKHKDEENAGKFWGGFGTTVAINAAIGAATGAAGAVATPARFASAAARVAIMSGAGAASSVLSQVTERGVENVFYGAHNNLFEGVAKTALTGAFVGGAAGALGEKLAGGAQTATSQNKLPGINKFEGSFKLRNFTGIRKILEPKPGPNPWLSIKTDAFLKTPLKSGLKYGAKVGFKVFQMSGEYQKLVDVGKSTANAAARHVV